MPKVGKRSPQENRKHEIRRAREQKQERFLFIGLGTVAGLIALILAFGYYQENIAKLNNPVAVVNGTPITVRDYQIRLKYDSGSIVSQLNSLNQNMQQLGTDPSTQFLAQYFQQQQGQLVSELSSLPQTDLDNMIDDELVRQEAAKRNITVSQDEIDQEIEKDFGYARATPTPTVGPSPTATQTSTPTLTPTATATYTPSPTPTGVYTPTTPTITPTPGPTDTPEPTSTPISYDYFQQQKKTFLDNISKNAGIGESDFRRMIETTLLRRKLQDAMSKDVATTAEQVNARHILVNDMVAANKVEEELKNGGDFAKLAAQYSTDTSNKDQGGDLGWFAKGAMVKEFEDAAFSLKVGEVSQPISTTYGLHIIQVLGHEQNRPLDASALQQVQSQALNDWLQTTRLKAKIDRYYSDAYVPADVKKAIANITNLPQ